MTVRKYTESNRFVFGPVPSRRLGRSLGIDLVPYKTCTLNCIYCECGPTTNLTVERKEYVPAEAVEADILDRLPDLTGRMDFITFSGSGEPTLSVSIPRITTLIRSLTETPLVLLTNGTLLYRDEVIRDIADIDVLIPSLDTVDPDIFAIMNRPHPDLNLDHLLEGLRRLRSVFTNKIWLEVFLCKGINDQPEHLAALGDEIRRINPDAVQLNTLYRPGAEPLLKPLTDPELQNAQEVMGITVQPPFISSRKPAEIPEPSQIRRMILNTIRRRPCTAMDLSSGLALPRHEVQTALDTLTRQDLVFVNRKSGKDFFIARSRSEPSDESI
ncbi:radical SAM protein [bacterium]|nr:radical SAM protein [candidate division CSSED10-310 bacterium]